MDKNIIVALSMIMDTQRIIVEQLNSIVDVIGAQNDLSVESGTIEVGDE